MMHPYTQAIFDKSDRGELLTERELQYLRNCTKPPTLKEWVVIILAQPILLTLVLQVCDSVY